MPARAAKTVVLSNDPVLVRVLERSPLARDEVDLLTAASASELLDRVTATAPALVVLGERVGEASGAELCFRLKSDPATAGVPIVFVGASAEGVPADAFVPAPPEREALLEAAAGFVALRRRAWPRVRKALRVEILRDDGEAVGYTKDLSAGGAFLRTPRPLEPGSEVQVLFDLPGEERVRVRAAARVARAVAQDRDSHLVAGVGLEFLRISGRDREAIRQFVEERERGLE